MAKLVSILIPAYNSQKWIGDTIQSALSQSWPCKEVVVVDDGSTDATLTIARQFASSSVHVIHQENGGACRARNRALRESQGEFVQFLDADDLLAPDKIELQMLASDIVGDLDVALLSAWGAFFEKPSKARFRPNGLWADLGAVEWLIMRLSNPWMIASHSWLVGRSLATKAGPWDESLLRNQDGEYFFRVISNSSGVKFVAASRCYYRKHNLSSVSHSSSQEAWESVCRSVQLETQHTLRREDSERSRAACFIRLTRTASMLEKHAPDLANILRQRSNDLVRGAQSPSRDRRLPSRIIRQGHDRIVKPAVTRVAMRASCLAERYLPEFCFRTHL